jgi:hypothetical protein
MKLHIKNNSDLVELRFCYVLLLLICTLFATIGFTRVLWAQILLLPFIRIIHLYSLLRKIPKLASNILLFLLTIFFIACYLLFFFRISFNVSVHENHLFVKIFLVEILLIIIFYKFILFSRCRFLSKYLLSAYRIFKKIYGDLLLIIICYVIVYRFLPREDNVSFLHIHYRFLNDWFWYEPFVYFYLLSIIIVGIWYVVSSQIRVMCKK